MQLAAEEGLVHAHAVHAAVAAQVHEKGGDQILGIVPQGQMGELVLRTELKQAFAAQPGAAETGGTALVLGRMGVRAEVRHLQMRGDAVLREPGGQRHMALRIETGIEMDGHDLETEGHDALPDMQGLEQHEAVHPAGNGHADAATGPDHAGLLHGLAGALDADLLRIGAFFAHMSSCPAGHVLR